MSDKSNRDRVEELPEGARNQPKVAEKPTTSGSRPRRLVKPSVSSPEFVEFYANEIGCW